MSASLTSMHAALLFLAASTNGIPVMHPQSPYVRSILELSSWTLWISLGIFLLITELVTYVGWRFRALPGQACTLGISLDTPGRSHAAIASASENACPLARLKTMP